MYNCSAAPSRSLDLTGTEATNAGRYSEPNACVRVAACNELPIAFRFVTSMPEGSFSTRRIQAVTAKGTTNLPVTEAKRLHDQTIALN
jgi:hypothetical protein